FRTRDSAFLRGAPESPAADRRCPVCARPETRECLVLRGRPCRQRNQKGAHPDEDRSAALLQTIEQIRDASESPPVIEKHIVRYEKSKVKRLADIGQESQTVDESLTRYAKGRLMKYKPYYATLGWNP